MRFEKVTYQELFPTGMYANQRLEVSIVLDKEGDNPKEAFRVGQQLVRESFNEINKEWLAQRGSEVIDLKRENVVVEKKEMDMIVRGWWDKAVREDDKQTMAELSFEFIIPE